MTDTAVLAKVQKLLRLAGNNSSPEEAALAAAKAQELIDQHQLTQAMLAMDSAEPTKGLDDEPILDFEKAGAPLDQNGRDRWRYTLASTIARWNACKIYVDGRLQIIGRPSDAETVRYLYAWLARETERLTTERGQGMGRTWRNNFRLGVVDTIARKLKEQHETFESNARSTARAENSTALMRVNQALANVHERRFSVEKWTKANVKLVSGGGSSARYDSSAREAGRRAGNSISLGGGRKGLTSAARKLSA